MPAISRPLEVKFILPALTEATSPYWRRVRAKFVGEKRPFLRFDGIEQETI